MTYLGHVTTQEYLQSCTSVCFPLPQTQNTFVYSLDYSIMILKENTKLALLLWSTVATSTFSDCAIYEPNFVHVVTILELSEILTLLIP